MGVLLILWLAAWVGPAETCLQTTIGVTHGNR